MIGFPFDSQVTYEPDGTPVFDRAISSAPLRQLIKKMLSNGVLPNPSTNLQVQPGAGMNVIVNPGFAVIEGGLKYEETQRTLAVQASDSTYDRIDTVVLRWNDNPNARNCDLYVIKGTPASKPVRPALNRESSVYEIGLADLFIAANSSAISSARITDTRYESARCGIISSIAEFDSDTIYEQIQADLAGFKADEQAQFLAWFEAIRDQLSEDAAGNLQLQINAMKTADTKDNTVSFESEDELVPATFADVELLQSGEKHNSFWRKASLMFKNVRRLIYLMGTTDISGIGNGTVTGGLSELNKKIIDVSNYNTLQEVFALVTSNTPILCYADWNSPIARSIDSQNAFLFITNWTCIAITYKGDIYRANKENTTFYKANQGIVMTLDGTTLNIQTDTW